LAAKRASERAEFALDVAESLGLPEPLTRAFNAKSLVAGARGHPNEAAAFLAQALAIALEHDLPDRAASSGARVRSRSAPRHARSAPRNGTDCFA